MIKPGEIQKKAMIVGVRDQQIEKDYILSWILFGISMHVYLSKTLVFKGGTVLKKVYFDDYRFSEDLDFTLLNTEISNEKIFLYFKQVFEFIIDEANIPLEINDNNEQIVGSIENLPAVMISAGILFLHIIGFLTASIVIFKKKDVLS